MSLLVIPRTVALLSEMEIDADKDWQGFGITNLKELAAGMQTGDTIAYNGAGLVKLSPSSIGDELTSGGAGHATTWKAPPAL